MQHMGQHMGLSRVKKMKNFFLLLIAFECFKMIEKHILTMNFLILGGFEHFLVGHFAQAASLTGCQKNGEKRGGKIKIH